MQLKDLLIGLVVPTICIAAAIPAADPQDYEWPDEVDIVGGGPSAQGAFPFIVSLQKSGSHFCGGSLLNANTVVTAAHCTVSQTASTLKVRAGSLSRTSGGTLVSVSSIKVNPAYKSSIFDGDVAIWKLATPIPASSTVGYATLPASGSDPAAGLLTTVAGWGTLTENGATLPTALQQVEVPIVSRATCRADYGTSSVTDQMICAGLTQGGKDSCQGDSGGPLVQSSNKVLVGLVSWGDGCAEANAPGVYTRVGAPAILSFINANL